MIFEWMELHKDELYENWEKCQRGEIPIGINPLK